MNDKLRKNLYTIIAIGIAILFTMVLTIYMKPMNDAYYDLSLINKSEDIVSEINDEKGWTVYTQEGKTITTLTHAGGGSYTGIELGQTFYLSRVMEEKLDSPTLQIGTGERNFVVFLDDEILYTDCSELDNRIGYLRLPMNDYDRTEPITITLPQNYQGKTLTIAQSTPEYSETSLIRAYPCSVFLYCGYSYESKLIAESFSTAIVATLAFATGIILLFFFVQVRKMEILYIALIAFAWMLMFLTSTSFFHKYFGNNIPDYIEMIRFLSILMLMIFLKKRAGKYKKFLWGMSVVYSISLIVHFYLEFVIPDFINPIQLFLNGPLSEWIAMATFVIVLVLGFLFWKKESQFYRLFCPLSLFGIILYWGFELITNFKNISIQFFVIINSFRISYFYVRTVYILIGVALFVAVIEAIQNELKQRTEKRLLEERREMTQITYESMCLQHEEVMKLRHDMMGHLETIREMTNEKSSTAYIDELIGKNKQIRSIIHTGNEVLDIILGSKLSVATDKGIKVEISRSMAPAKLPLSDADLSSLVINILNNAINAAFTSGVETPSIIIDVHTKGSWLAITCENSADIRQIEKERKKETVPKHGLGLKIIKNIAEQYNCLFDTEYGKNYYKVNVIIPLD